MRERYLNDLISFLNVAHTSHCSAWIDLTTAHNKQVIKTMKQNRMLAISNNFRLRFECEREHTSFNISQLVLKKFKLYIRHKSTHQLFNGSYVNLMF
jgi:hypothetical protein